jgi:hypothetical protein
VTALAAFGLRVELPFELPVAASANGHAGPAVLVEVVPAGALAWSGTDLPAVWRTVLGDGSAVRVEHGRDGDYRFAYGEAAVFVIAPAADRIRVAVRDPQDPAWRRFLLDTVLWWTALLHGFRLVHAGAVVVDGRLVAVLSQTGGGKSTLVWELLRRGGTLYCDDVLALRPRPGAAPIAHPGPPVMNLPTGLAERFRPGPELARFGPPEEETWIAVDQAPPEPLPVAAAILYGRSAGAELAFEPLAPSPLNLVPHSWDLPHLAERAAGRFELLADFAEHTAAYSLLADLTCPVEEIADLLAAHLRERSAT